MLKTIQEVLLFLASLPFAAKVSVSAAILLLAVTSLIVIWQAPKAEEATVHPAPDITPSQAIPSMSPSSTPMISPEQPSPSAEVKKEMKTNSCPPVDTNDKRIDDTQRALCDLRKDPSNPPSDTELVQALKPLFTRPAFYGIREENWEHFLFILCKTRTLLEENVTYFKSSNFRREVGRAIQLMVRLQNDVARIYGPTFSITTHMQRFLNSKDEFINRLPKINSDPEPNFFNDRDKTINEIRAILRPLGLTDF
ncbi:MAG TPA: hypothetical protein VF435_00735 [Pyrinomonadaceae bacterium]